MLKRYIAGLIETVIAESMPEMIEHALDILGPKFAERMENSVLAVIIPRKDALEARVTELLTANTALLEENRKLKQQARWVGGAHTPARILPIDMATRAYLDAQNMLREREKKNAANR